MADYDDLPTSGTHKKPHHENETGTEVRAPDAPDDTAADEPGTSTYQLLHAPEQAHYRLQSWDEGAPLPEGYAELGRYGRKDLASALAPLSERARFVVLENSKTGEVHLENMSNISANWTDGGRFDRVTLFEDQSDAANYVASRHG